MVNTIKEIHSAQLPHGLCSDAENKLHASLKSRKIHYHILPFCIGKGKLQSGVNKATRQRISKTLEAIFLLLFNVLSSSLPG